ncbi:MAG: hypothetical protein L0Y56_06040, partial [Nitrospira sp.]|nr:hypothetical protein [Nitrospira sp.]
QRKREFSPSELKAKFPQEWKRLQALADRRLKPEMPDQIWKSIVARAEKLARGRTYNVPLPEYGLVVEGNIGWMEADSPDLRVGKIKSLGKAPQRFAAIARAVEKDDDLGESIRSLVWRKLRKELQIMRREIRAVCRKIDRLPEEYNVDLEELEHEVDQTIIDIRDNL